MIIIFESEFIVKTKIIKSKKNVFVNTTQVKFKINTRTVIKYLIDA